ncbi:nuclear transport factor 2 family protein [Halomarina salina]|uniref:Nuclear transport factor 2 family protein n=1 Tax=Halomarina salina TaxID=1872699 RepID=A0ABD5RN61_9EURY|nr:nuclear transport factor 2 family protein [Halomarina salina]
MDAVALAREYYRVIDDADYDALADLLAPGFAHDRPDQSIEGGDRFVRFMREERPETDTSHDLDAVYVLDGEAADETSSDDSASGGTEVAVRGRLRRADGSVWFGFVDVFAVEEGHLAHLRTYTH